MVPGAWVGLLSAILSQACLDPLAGAVLDGLAQRGGIEVAVFEPHSLLGHLLFVLRAHAA